MVIDARGMLCPQPLIATKKAIDNTTEPTYFEVILDNDIAICNVEEYISQLGIESKRDGNKVCFTCEGIGFTSGDVAYGCSVRGEDYVVVISSLSMGRGSEELGGILLKAFVSTLSQSDKLPSHILLYNEGVKCATQMSGFLDALQSMESAGTMIVVCGTCVEYYGIKDQISVGAISNMYKIVHILQSASKVIYP